ncbi:hypothetical protein K488DRAFT_86827 [Vararia minispora EC-137]|uniref:Uncharacterized protein n=1 Tax=Vararia minispora EC-137 TaxID=1314806 RepID=A0ACB8QIL7_9AGAM|nr:hypothetical protein K488DRAFT_86827 [Vararia minispora EC-137]
MSTKRTLKDILAKLSSKKVKERTEGLTALKAALERDQAINDVDSSGNKTWLVLFQHLFNVVLTEKSTCVKKTTKNLLSGSAAQARVKTAAETVRWLVERCMQKLGRKALSAVVVHLLRTLAHDGELYDPIALHYIKSIRVIVSYTPHLEHLDPDLWTRIVEMAWNIVLGDPLRRLLNVEEEEELTEDIAMVSAEDEDEDEDEGSVRSPKKRRKREYEDEDAPASRKKRSRSASITPGPSNRATPFSTPIQSVTPEQVECTALLAVLLRHPSAPILSSDEADTLTAHLLDRHLRFIQRYSSDTSLHLDFLLGLSATLSHLALNKREAITHFSRSAWDGLLSMWGYKNKSLKEHLVVILRVLFPFYASRNPSRPHEVPFDYTGGLATLWGILEDEVDHRRGFEGLSLDCLRLQLHSSSDVPGDGWNGTFVARTFRHGMNFDVIQAFAWSILELQADCAFKLFTFSETVHNLRTGSLKREGKRARLENPIAVLINSVQTSSNSTCRVFRLQTVLFFIDRYWPHIHDDLRAMIMQPVMQLVSSDNPTIQSWAFLCLTAVAAHQVGTTNLHPTTWEHIWAHAMRRVNAPDTSRAACYTAHVLLSSKSLSSRQILPEIESFAKDLDVQGPPYPHDSVCMLMTSCLQVANQDMRLFRMCIEDKVLSWLSDAWSHGEALAVKGVGRKRIARPFVSDILAMLETICALPVRSELACRTLLPESPLVEQVIEEQRTSAIRMLLLQGSLPPFLPSPAELSRTANPKNAQSVEHFRDLVQPGPRERKVSATILKFLEALQISIDGTLCGSGQLTDEKCRQLIDAAILAVTFESLLVYNGIRSNAHVLQIACMLLKVVIPALSSNRWTREEQATVLSAFEPLVWDGEDDEDEGWNGLIGPTRYIGIRREVLRQLTDTARGARARLRRKRHELQRIIWQSADVQDVLAELVKAMKKILCSLIAKLAGDQTSRAAVDSDDHDGFASIRPAALTTQMPEAKSACIGSPAYSIMVTCMLFLASGPVLQSLSSEPNCDLELSDVLLDAGGEEFILAVPAFLSHMRRRNLNLSITALDNFLVKTESLLTQYTYSHSDALQQIVVSLLDSTMELWTRKDTDVGTLSKIQDIFRWLGEALEGQKMRSWRVRDRLTELLRRYLILDPQETIWKENYTRNGVQDDSQDEGVIQMPPSLLLPTLNADVDIRVRFRSAKAMAALFPGHKTEQTELVKLYKYVHAQLRDDVANYEYMLTRLLVSANIVIACATVAYASCWHMLEVCLYSNDYDSHVATMLEGIASRMNLPHRADFFMAYVAQIAFSSRDFTSEMDFILRINPILLGFRDRKALATATFRYFAQALAHCGNEEEAYAQRGRKRLVALCNSMDKRILEGLQDAFADIVSYELVWAVKHVPDKVDQQIARSLDDCSEDLYTSDNFHRSLDSIFVSVLRMLGDQDVTYDCSIANLLEARYPKPLKCQRSFQELTGFRVLANTRPFPPNAPAEDASVILDAVEWIKDKAGQESVTAATSYHIFHQLIADIHRTPLVNEQLRLINALCLWIALYPQHFVEPMLLHSLVHSTSILLAQFDVARAAQGILAWAFKQYGGVSGPRFADARITDVLVRIATVANTYAVSNDAAEQKLGHDLAEFIDMKVADLLKCPFVKEQAVRALLSWPREPCAALEKVRREASVATVMDVLEDPRTIANKFRAVRRLRESPRSDYPVARFSRVDFWRLKERIPPRGQLDIEDVDSFAALLIEHSGHIYGFGTGPLSAQMGRSTQTRVRKVPDPKDPSGTADIHEVEEPERVLLEHLLCVLDAADPARVREAYHVLRTISSTRLPDASNWAQEYAIEMYYFSRCPRPAISRPAFDLQSLNSLVDVAKEFNPWVSTVACAISDTIGKERPFFAQLFPILQADTGFAELALPTLIHTLLRMHELRKDDPSMRTVLSQYFIAVLSAPTSHISCIRTVVNVVLHMRHFYPTRHQNDYLAPDKWLELDYMLLSRSAIRCGAYTTALLFHELAFEYSQDQVSPSDSEDILFNIYSHVDEPDGFYGIHTHDSHRFLIKRFHHEQQWDKAFMFHGAALEARRQDISAASGVLQSLHSVGFDNLALSIQGSSSRDLADAAYMNYDLGWRTQTWDLPEQPNASLGASDALYRSLRAIHRERDPANAAVVVHDALGDVMDHLRVLGDEDIEGIRNATQILLCLSQIKQWQGASVQESLAHRRLDTPMWEAFTSISPNFDFTTLENIMATRMSLLSSIRQKEQRLQIGDMVSTFTSKLEYIEKCCLVRISEAARSSNHLQIALNSVVRARTLEAQSSPSFSQEFANVLWDQKEHNVAFQTLKDVLYQYFTVNGQDESASAGKALLLSRLGSWAAEACMQKPMSIWEDYFEPAVQIISALGYQIDASTARIFHECAIFADRQYHALARSPDAIRRRVYVDRKVNEVRELESQTRRGIKDAESMMRKARRQLEADRESYELHVGALFTFLQQAASMYARCLETSEKYDDDAHIRLVSLWYANFDDTRLADVLGPAIERVPSSKFIFLSHQLTARLAKHEPEASESKSRKTKSTSPESVAANQEILQKLVLRMCIEHPFHTIYQLFPLRPVDGAGIYRRHSQRLDSSQPQSQRDRAAAAADIFSKLRQGQHARRVLDVESFCQECLHWAKYSVKTLVLNSSAKEHSAVGKTKLVEESFFRGIRVPVPTVYTPVDPTMQYEDCVWVQKYAPFFKTAGGINLPKIQQCVGSNGKRYTQLFKGEGNDDIRQDAVMKQVFDLVDIALRRDRRTSRRNLTIRRFCVIPLAEQAGILEFVNDTEPLDDWLVGAHRRYRPRDVLPAEFRRQMVGFARRIERMPARAAKMLEWYLSTQLSLQPVMRHWFTERHKLPMSWFAMRLNYTRSVATTSIVGHLLGLGDRHTHNILLDQSTGEVVHIDLGIAFEQGKMLPVPEVVPFRLTRDMVDGMGTTGVRGVFQRCAEETLRVLREDSEVILTVLEVFKYDPLHSWTASDLKINRMQEQQQQTVQPVPQAVMGIGIDMNSGTADEAADRALSAVARKLDRALSVEYTVNELIAEATDPANLCVMFPGWSPYL